MKLRLGCEVEVLRPDDGSHETFVDRLQVRLFDAPFLPPPSEQTPAVT